MPTITDRAQSLSERLVAGLHRPLEGEIRSRAALHVLDWTACAVAGRSSEIGEILAGHAETAVHGPVHALSVGRRSLEAALTVNAALGAALDMGDRHRDLDIHPGAIIIPAALATAEAAGAAPIAFLEAVTRGYETMIRTAALLRPTAAPIWDLSATTGRLGAAVAVGCIVGLDDAALVSALGLAAGAATLRQPGTDTSLAAHVRNMEAALGGTRAALLAARGVTGPRLALDGPEGLVAAIAPDADLDLLTAASDDWRIMEVSFLPWGACRHAHAAIDAALELRPEVNPDSVRSIRVRTYEAALHSCDIARPHSVTEARFSLQHAVAVALAKGAPVMEDFDLSACGEADIAALRDKVELSADPAFSARFPGHAGAAVEVEHEDGRTVSAILEDAGGDPERPLSLDVLVAKARELMAWSGFMSEAEADRIIEAALYLPDAPNLSSFLKALP